MARNRQEWLEKPAFPNTHFVDTRVYTDEALFREEQD